VSSAARRLVLTAARSLRRGASREAVLNRVRLDYSAIERRHPEARRSKAMDAVTAELDRWLPAAGFPATETPIEITR
jgi:hypothetical protein